MIGIQKAAGAYTIPENANTYVQPITDKAIRAKTKSILTDLFN